MTNKKIKTNPMNLGKPSEEELASLPSIDQKELDRMNDIKFKSLQSGINYFENQNTQLIEKNKVQEATINFYKGLLNRTIESYATEICQVNEVE